MARWHSCNVLEVEGGRRRVWHFDARNGTFSLNREQIARPGENLPGNIVTKSWGALFQRKLNVAWLPPENVFIRVAQFPQASPDETRSMVELQLEKLSPIPVTHAMWTMHILPHASGDMQTVVLTIVSRPVVEEFLGHLEGSGFLADRLESPLLDQLQGTPVTGDGAWIYPEVQGGRNTALVAWWYGGILRNVDLVTIPVEADRVAALRDQLMQLTWAGELDGWLTAPPKWHLVAGEKKAADWISPLREALGQDVEVIAPQSDTEIAARTARRAAEADPSVNLLPAEFAIRYQRNFVDRLWLRGLGALLMIYMMGLAVYFVALNFLSYKTNEVVARARALGVNYTNAMQVSSKVDILKDREALKYAALDCWLAVAELLPENITLENMDFRDGNELRLSGTAPEEHGLAVIDFSGKLRRHTMRGQPLFDPARGDQLTTSRHGAAGTISWSFSCVLRRGEQR